MAPVGFLVYGPEYLMCSGLIFLMLMTETDIEYMRMALDEAVKGEGAVNPNPLVGAVIVMDGKVIGKGYHRAFGQAHAEPEAIASCNGRDLRGATLYVTLEPCCHYGKRPPCTEAIMASGISRVVAAMKDPNPLVAGKGLEILRNAGIEVECGVLEDEAKMMNRAFIKYITTGIPWVVMKGAMTLDGKIASASGDSKWVSSPASREYVQRLRNRCMAILVGSGTVKADDPMLNCRIPGGRSPIRVILDSTASIDPLSQIVRTASEYRTVVVHTDSASEERLEMLRSLGVETLGCKSDGHGIILSDMLARLGEMKIDSILVEGGSEVNWSFIQNGLADEYYLFVAPKIVGGASAKTLVGGCGFSAMGDAAKLDIESVGRVSDDILIHSFFRK